MRVLMVEDEKHMAEAIAQVLKKNNYIVDLAYDGEYGLDCALSGIYDIIILDVMLPKLDGLSILTSLREEGVSVPVLLLTAKGGIADKVQGLDCGADDYLAKPFHTDELLARLRALGRRNNDLQPLNILVYEDTELDPLSLMLRCGAASFKLTPKECNLLEILIRRVGTVISKESIIEKLWGYESEADDNHVEVYISFLRKKLAHINSRVFIRTVRGIGYALAVQPEIKTAENR